ncbi:hypothetical protein Cgig2_028672 [Carnegiea gigantea]|uniref:Glucan endo-1,3-beta-D-glucosidase n=1 Tax=Carnegiea gigantea TaxID=171969 RepID=A0A9Q1KC06_9CARY|nr:hypothetical protein Cgig2_028672 [Carnegiea gigantea]
MLNFHSQIKAPFLINAYPFFAYKDNPDEISLDYVLFRPNPGMRDPDTGLHYDNMLYAQIDSVYSAIRQMGHNDIEVQVSETGWPSKGDPDEIGASPENAAAYNGNLMKRIERNEGTPGRPSEPINVHVFALFNENLKPGPSSERNYGLFYPDGTPVYNIGLQGMAHNGTNIELLHSIDYFLVKIFLNSIDIQIRKESDQIQEEILPSNTREKLKDQKEGGRLQIPKLKMIGPQVPKQCNFFSGLSSQIHLYGLLIKEQSREEKEGKKKKNVVLVDRRI